MQQNNKQEVINKININIQHGKNMFKLFDAINTFKDNENLTNQVLSFIENVIKNEFNPTFNLDEYIATHGTPDMDIKKSLLLHFMKGSKELINIDNSNNILRQLKEDIQTVINHHLVTEYFNATGVRAYTSMRESLICWQVQQSKYADPSSVIIHIPVINQYAVTTFDKYLDFANNIITNSIIDTPFKLAFQPRQLVLTDYQHKLVFTFAEYDCGSSFPYVKHAEKYFRSLISVRSVNNRLTEFTTMDRCFTNHNDARITFNKFVETIKDPRDKSCFKFVEPMREGELNYILVNVSTGVSGGYRFAMDVVPIFDLCNLHIYIINRSLEEEIRKFNEHVIAENLASINMNTINDAINNIIDNNAIGNVISDINAEITNNINIVNNVNNVNQNNADIKIEHQNENKQSNNSTDKQKSDSKNQLAIKWATENPPHDGEIMSDYYWRYTQSDIADLLPSKKFHQQTEKVINMDKDGPRIRRMFITKNNLPK